MHKGGEPSLSPGTRGKREVVETDVTVGRKQRRMAVPELGAQGLGVGEVLTDGQWGAWGQKQGQLEDGRR